MMIMLLFNRFLPLVTGWVLGREHSETQPTKRAELIGRQKQKDLRQFVCVPSEKKTEESGRHD